MADQPVTPSPAPQERTYSAAEVEALQRRLEQVEQRAQITDRFHSLRSRAEKLVGELKLSTAAFEEMFGIEPASQRSLIDGMAENPGHLDQIEFYLNMQEKTAVPPTSFGKSVVGETPLPPPPQERQGEVRSQEEIQASAQRLVNAAAHKGMVI